MSETKKFCLRNWHGKKNNHGDIDWYAENDKKPFTYSTRAESDCICLLAEEYGTWGGWIYDAVTLLQGRFAFAKPKYITNEKERFIIKTLCDLYGREAVPIVRRGMIAGKKPKKERKSEHKKPRPGNIS